MSVPSREVHEIGLRLKEAEAEFCAVLMELRRRRDTRVIEFFLLRDCKNDRDRQAMQGLMDRASATSRIVGGMGLCKGESTDDA